MRNLYLAILLPILLVHGCTTQPEPADAIYLGGRVYTASPDMPWAEAMVVRGDELVYVGGSDGATAYQARVAHDLGGRNALG